MNKSPKILKISWGKMVIENYGSGKDFILYPGGAEPWDWNNSGTNHSVGIQPSDVEKLLEKGAEVVVLSQGMFKRLTVSSEVINILKNAEVEYKILETPKAAEYYNSLCGNIAVGGLFHSTC